MQENTPFGVSELLVQAQRMKKWYEEALHAVAVQYGLTMNELSVLLFLANNPALNTARDIVQLRACQIPRLYVRGCAGAARLSCAAGR